MADLTDARAALDEGDYAGALLLLPAPAAGDVSAEVWEARARAAYGAGAFEQAVSAWEALFALQRQQGDDDAAGYTAATVALHLMVDSGLMAAVRGWVARADALVAGRPEGPTHALLAMVRPMSGSSPATLTRRGTMPHERLTSARGWACYRPSCSVRSPRRA